MSNRTDPSAVRQSPPVRKIIPAEAQATVVIGLSGETRTVTLLIPPADRSVTERERRGILALWEQVPQR